MPEIPVHPDIAPLSFLLGTWSGVGTGSYPTISPFSYRETIEVTHVGKPFLAYRQRTSDAADGRPLHAESGYWRLSAGTDVELILAHPSGILEQLAGSLATGPEGAHVIELVSTAVLVTATAKPVTEIDRWFAVDADTISYRVAMAAVGEPLTHHLAATLRRESGHDR